MVKKIASHDISGLWASFAERHALTAGQLEQFKTYYRMLKDTNDIHNLTAITDLRAVIHYHFDDSLALGNFVAMHDITGIADVGSGGGFPGIPLKIKYPHVSVILIEVTHKKIEFLHSVIAELGLEHIQVYDLDWRTFLRKTDYVIDIFCARASLQPQELMRVFKPSTAYTDSKLVYWAARDWQPASEIQAYTTGQEQYTVGNKHRKLVFFSRPS
jgi:16S rRNA (guanine527-N7)-methyltransferase